MSRKQKKLHKIAKSIQEFLGKLHSKLKHNSKPVFVFWYVRPIACTQP